MDNNQNQLPTDHPQDVDIDTRIAAEHHYGVYQYEETMFDRVTSAVAENKLILLPVIVVPIILLASVMGINAANSNKKTNIDKIALTQQESPIEYSIETIGTTPTEDTGPAILPNTGTSTSTPANATTSPTPNPTSTNSRTSSAAPTRINTDDDTDTPSNQPIDLCTNLHGNQINVPVGQTRDEAGRCTATPIVIDLCNNLEGNQITVPSGQIRNANGTCTPRVIDVCVNLPDTQAKVPTGYIRDSAGNCTRKPVVVPSKVDLRPWKVTLPVGKGGDPIEQPATKLYSPWYTKISSGYQFYVDSARATARTPNSPNIRSELREMQAGNPSKTMTWYPQSGVHQMLVRLKVTKNTGKGHVVIAQIHGADDDVTVFRLERISSTKAKLWFARGDETHGYDPRITVAIGQTITVGFKVQNSQIQYLYDAKGSKNPKVIHTWKPGSVKGENVGADFRGGSYFKTGNYQQSKDYSGRSESAVTIMGLGLSHNGRLPDIGGN